MIQITKHGNAYHKGLCRYCKCEFNFFNLDIIKDELSNNKYPYKFICPECFKVFRTDKLQTMTKLLEYWYNIYSEF